VRKHAVTNAWLLPIALLLAGCGSRSGLPIPESNPIESSSDAGVSPNPLCASAQPSEVITLRTGEMQPARIGVSSEHLIVAEWPFTGDVFRMSRTGAGEHTVLSSDEASVNQLIADSKAAFWVVQGLGGTDGALRSASSSSSKASTRVGLLTRPQGVASFGDFVYFTDGLGPPNDPVNGRIQRVKRGEGAASVLASGLGDPMAIAVDATGVYFGDGAALYSLPHSGGAPTLISEVPASLRGLTTDGQRLFWFDAGSVFRRDHATGVTTTVATDLGWIEDIVADAAGAYLVRRDGPSDTSHGSVFAIRENGVELLTSSDEAPLGIAIDASAIYFVTIHASMGSVSMLCRRGSAEISEG
jgi:hypothetical protein